MSKKKISKLSELTAKQEITEAMQNTAKGFQRHIIRQVGAKIFLLGMAVGAVFGSVLVEYVMWLVKH